VTEDAWRRANTLVGKYSTDPRGSSIARDHDRFLADLYADVGNE
jgi:hypothetical protein